MTQDERFERIEGNLQEVTEILKRVALLTESNQKALAGLVTSVDAFVDSSNAYVQESKVRMAQIEANLDNLIRIITAEHSNGKGKK